MKTRLFVVSFIALTLIFSTNVFGQRGRRAPDVRQQRMTVERPVEDRSMGAARGGMQAHFNIPNLTEEQQEQINALRLRQMERTTHQRNEMDELRARKRTLMTQTQTDARALDQVIDKMTGLQNAQMKENVQHRQAVRDLLTEEQRIVFDSHTMQRTAGRNSMGQMHGKNVAPAHGHSASPAPRRGRW